MGSRRRRGYDADSPSRAAATTRSVARRGYDVGCSVALEWRRRRGDDADSPPTQAKLKDLKEQKAEKEAKA